MEPRKVLVGVEKVDCEAAMHYAVEDAVRRRCGIHLAHVAHLALAVGWSGEEISVVDGQLRHVDELVLAAAQARTQALLDELAPGDDDLTVSTELVHGRVVAMMGSLSRHASRLVLQHERADAGLTSTSAGLAAVAHCPVVVVPRAWRPVVPPSGAVVVGVKELVAAAPLVTIADEEAAVRGARLRVVVVREGDDPVRRAEPDLPPTTSPVDLVVETGTPADVLLDHATGAELLVVGRHHRDHLLGVPLGRTVRELVERCPVPLLVTDAVHHPGNES